MRCGRCGAQIGGRKTRQRFIGADSKTIMGAWRWFEPAMKNPALVLIQGMDHERREYCYRRDRKI